MKFFKIQVSEKYPQHQIEEILERAVFEPFLGHFLPNLF